MGCWKGKDMIEWGGGRRSATPQAPYPDIAIDPFKKLGPFLNASSAELLLRNVGDSEISLMASVDYGK